MTAKQRSNAKSRKSIEREKMLARQKARRHVCFEKRRTNLLFVNE